MVIQVIPVRVRNDDTSGRWYARALTHSISGRGDTPKDAMSDLRTRLNEILENSSVEVVLSVRSVNVTFPELLGEADFQEWIEHAKVPSSV